MMRCDAMEPLFEGIADGSVEATADDLAHVASCAVCAARLERARAIEQWLSAREVPQPPPSFTASVLTRIGQEKWRTERAFDIGFNLAIVAGVMVIVASAAGAAWSLGALAIDIDASLLTWAMPPQLEARLTAQLQTIALAVVLLASALGLWWWAEAATD